MQCSLAGVVSYPSYLLMNKLSNSRLLNPIAIRDVFGLRKNTIFTRILENCDSKEYVLQNCYNVYPRASRTEDQYQNNFELL
jgi:hypothetical protein